MAELFVDYPQGMGPSLLDPSIDLTAVVTGSGLPALLIDFLTNLSLPQVIDIWSPQVPKESSAILLLKQRSGTRLLSISPRIFPFGYDMYFADIL